VGTSSDPVRDQQTAAGATIVAIREIKRSALPDGIRVSVELDGEATYHVERLDNPQRVFFDFRGTRSVAALQDATPRFDEGIGREIRLGRHPKNMTRVVFDMEGAESHSAFTLYNPFRLVIDFRAVAAPDETRPGPVGSAGQADLPPLAPPLQPAPLAAP